jgi:hypothetical protein
VVSSILSRGLHAQLNAFTELEGRKTTVALSGADQIVHAEEVRRYLTREDTPSAKWSKDGLQVLFFPGLDHAHVFDSKKHRKTLLDVTRAYSTVQPTEFN